MPLLRVWFSSSLLWDRVHKSGRLGLEEGIIFQETAQNKKKSNRRVQIYATQSKSYSRIREIWGVKSSIG